MWYVLTVRGLLVEKWAHIYGLGDYLAFVLQDIIGLIIGGDTFAPEEKIPLHRNLCNVLIRKGYVGFVGVFDFAALYRFLE